MKGVSPIISTVLMIAIAIAAAVVVYYVTMNIVSTQGSQAEQQATAGQDIIQIVGIGSWNDTNKDINVWVYNGGNTKVQIVSAYVLQENGNTVCGPNELTKIENNTIDSKTTQRVLVDFDQTKCTKSLSGTYQLKLVTKNGATAMKAFNT